MAVAQTEQFVLPDGRTLNYAVYGATEVSSPDQQPPTVFYFHGFPSSHHEARMLAPAAKAHGLRMIAASRPGHGGSTFQENRTLLDWPADVVSLADHLRVKRFAIAGVSAGSPYVLTCLRALPKDRLAGAAIVSGMYPTSVGVEGMMLSLRFLLWVTPWMTGLVGAGLDFGMGRVARDTEHPEKFEQSLMAQTQSRPAADRAVLESNQGGVRDAMVLSTRESFLDGGQGPAWDLRLLSSAWGYSLEDLKVDPGRLVMWHGEEDVNTPLGMAKKAAALIRNAELRLAPGEAHLSLVANKADECMATLKAMLAGG